MSHNRLEGVYPYFLTLVQKGSSCTAQLESCVRRRQHQEGSHGLRRSDGYSRFKPREPLEREGAERTHWQTHLCFWPTRQSRTATSEEIDLLSQDRLVEKG